MVIAPSRGDEKRNVEHNNKEEGGEPAARGHGAFAAAAEEEQGGRRGRGGQVRDVGLGGRHLDHGEDDVAPHVGVVRVDLFTDRLERFKTFILEWKSNFLS